MGELKGLCPRAGRFAPLRSVRGPAGFCGCGVAWGLVEDKAEEV